MVAAVGDDYLWSRMFWKTAVDVIAVDEEWVMRVVSEEMNDDSPSLPKTICWVDIIWEVRERHRSWR